MKLRSVVGAAVGLFSVAHQASRVAAQDLGEACVHSGVALPPHLTNRLVPPGNPVFAGCETEDGSQGLAPSGSAPLPVADASGGDNTMDFSS